MPTIPPDTELNREDVVGQQIVSIVQSGKTNDDKGLDWAFNFFYLRSGAVFCLPDEDAGGFVVASPPENAEPIQHPDIEFVLGQRIVQVLRDGSESDLCHDSPYLIMENGFIVTDIMGAPHGTGSVGVYIYRPDEVDLSTLIDFFH